MIETIDHIVLTVADLEATRRFYVEGLGMDWLTFDEDRHALGFSEHKINLHVKGREFEPKAAQPTPGSGDFCLLTRTPLEEIAEAMEALGYPVIEGPAPRTGATGALLSVYFRDPDGNLVEVANPA